MAEEQFATMSGFTINCMSFLKSLRRSWYHWFIKLVIHKISYKIPATKLKNMNLGGAVGSSTTTFIFA